MEQKLGYKDGSCTWEGDIYPSGYSCCEDDSCMTCRNGEWVKNDNPSFAGSQ
jgi:hypothetical protein